MAGSDGWVWPRRIVICGSLKGHWNVSSYTTKRVCSGVHDSKMNSGGNRPSRSNVENASRRVVQYLSPLLLADLALYDVKLVLNTKCEHVCV